MGHDVGAVARTVVSAAVAGDGGGRLAVLGIALIAITVATLAAALARQRRELA